MRAAVEGMLASGWRGDPNRVPVSAGVGSRARWAARSAGFTSVSVTDGIVGAEPVTKRYFGEKQ